jgi:hypothetical protein
VNEVTLEVRFQSRCTPAIAVQRLMTVLSHQRAPLVDLRVRRCIHSSAVHASLRFGALTPEALDQVTMRLARDWSVLAVQHG